MGVDARIFARIKGRENWLRDKDELVAAYQLASSLGHQHFFITKGNDPICAEHHALSIVRPIKDAETAAEYGLSLEHLGKVVYHQDGPEIFADDDEQFIEVHLWSRYYGPCYARGDWPTIRTVAEWLEWRFPNCEVWYGGDSSGICAAHLTEEVRKEFSRLYLSSGTTAYHRGFSGVTSQGHTPPTCPTCEQPLYSTGGGGGQCFWFCDGCGKQGITKGGNLRWLKRNSDFFKPEFEEEAA